MKNMTEGKPLRLILFFAIPMFIGRLFGLFYSLVDTRIVGETLGEASLAAVGATSTLSDLLTNLLNGFANGAAIIVATYFGAKDEKNVKKAAGGTALIGVGSAAAVSVLCLLFLGPILRFMNIADDIFPQAQSYIRIVLAGFLASACYNLCAAVLRAVGDSFTPLLFLVIASVLNIALDYLFILWFHMGVEGAAYATVVSQALSAAACFIYMRKKYPLLALSGEDMKIEKEVYRRLVTTGSSMAFMTSFVSLGTLALQTSINTFGTNIIVAHTAARKATSVFMLPFSVLGTTLATYCGQNLGAGKYSRIRKGIKDTVLLTFGWCVFVVLIVFTSAPSIVWLITSSRQQEILDTASLYLKVNTSFYFVPAVILLFRNSMQGIGDNKTPVFSSSLELVGKVAIAFLLAPVIGYMGIILSEPIVWFIMVIPLVVNIARNPVLRMEDAAPGDGGLTEQG